MPTATRTFRVFVSSTFEDLKDERNALAAPGGPFAELTKLCQSFGARFQAIDLRWGVREEAGLDQRTMEICLGEIERCQRTGIKPNFIVLLGDRYGWLPLPARIEAEEFRAVRDRITDEEDRARVDDWYRLDENAVPPEYLLRPRTGEFKDIHRWGDVETTMHEALREAAHAAGLSGTALIKYEASATHQEILKGLGKTAEDREHVLAFFCKPSETNEDPGLAKLKQFLRDELSGSVFEPRGTAELCERVRENLDRVIRAEAAAFKSRPALDIEVEAHDTFARDRARHFMGRKDVLDSIDQYLKGGDRQPMVVHGASGSGKSAVMARALEVLLGNPGNALVIRRFIGVTPESSSGITLLRSLCEEIGRRYGVAEEIPVEFHSVVRTFAGRLALATADRPLVLFIDAIDQIAASDPAANITWLMPELPPHCRVVLSTTDGALSLEGARRLELRALPAQDAEGALALWLNDAGREWRAWQREKVLAYYSWCGLPLYLRLAFEEVRRWRSFDEPEACALGEGLSGIIDVLFERLSSGAEHGKVLVSRSLGYLASARYGLTENEMLDLLTQNPDVWNEFDSAKRHDPPDHRIPVIVWSRLFLDLEPYLRESIAQAATVATFYHRQLPERILAKLITGAEQQAAHAQLAGYFQECLDRLPATSSDSLQRGKLPTARIRCHAELPWQLKATGDWVGLSKYLSKDRLFAEAWLSNDYEVKGYWADVEANSEIRMVQVYRRVIASPQGHECCFPVGVLLSETGHYEEAQWLLEAVVETAKEAERFGSEHYTVVLRVALPRLAGLYRRLNRPDDAMIAYEECERVSRESRDDPGVVAALNGRANVLDYKGDYQGAVTLYEEAERVSQTRGFDITTLLLNEARCLMSLGNVEKASALCKQVLDTLRVRGDNEGESHATEMMADILLRQRRFGEAMLLYEEVEVVFRRVGDVSRLANVLCHQAFIQATAGQSYEALRLFSEAEAIAVRLGGHSEALVASRAGKADILFSRGEFASSMKLYQQNELECRVSGDRKGFSGALGGRATILLAMNELPAALELLSQCEEISRALGDEDGLQRAIGNIALVFLRSGRASDAMAMLQEQQAICQRIGDRESLARCWGNQAAVHSADHKYDSAISMFLRQRQLLQDLNAKSELTACLYNLGCCYLATRDFQAALDILHQHEIMCRESSLWPQLVTTLSMQGVAHSEATPSQPALAVAKATEAVALARTHDCGTQVAYAVEQCMAIIQATSSGATSELT